jgi:hypothetical protein
VKNLSSPTAKLEFIANFMQKVRLEEGELQEADSVVSLMILAFMSLGKRSGDLLIEVKYIQAFSSDDLYDIVQSGQSLAHIETAIEKVISGQI